MRIRRTRTVSSARAILPCDRMLAIYEYQDARATSSALRPPEVPRMFFRLWGSRAGIPQGLANATSGDLAPKWLDPRQDRIRVGCAVQNRVEEGVLSPPPPFPRERARWAA